MYVYIDTSALVKLYVDERESEEVRRVRDRLADPPATHSNYIAISSVTRVEMYSALSRRTRSTKESERISREDAYRLAREFDADRRDLYVVRPVTEQILMAATSYTFRHNLRAYDALQLATAVALRDELRQTLVRRATDADRTAPPDPALRQAIADALEDEHALLMLAYDRDLYAACEQEGVAYPLPPPKSTSP